VTQGTWIRLAGAFASSSTGTRVSAIAISGGLGVVLAAALAMSWRSHSANRTNLFLSSRRLAIRSIRCASRPPLGMRSAGLRGGVRSIHCALQPPSGMKSDGRRWRAQVHSLRIAASCSGAGTYGLVGSGPFAAHHCPLKERYAPIWGSYSGPFAAHCCLLFGCRDIWAGRVRSTRCACSLLPDGRLVPDRAWSIGCGGYLIWLLAGQRVACIARS
jgi:hypothetical protein